MDEIKVSIKKLNNLNYSTWKYRMELLLIKEDVWDIVKDDKIAKDDKWSAKDNKAKAMIGLMLEDSQLIHVKKLKTASEYWSTLQRFHEKPTLINKVTMLKKICRLRLQDDGKMEAHLQELSEMVDRLSEMGEPLAENLIVAFILSSLPESYETIVMALETRLESELTVEMVKERLIQESKRREELKEENKQAAMKVKSYTKEYFYNKGADTTKTSKICYFCKKKGHFKDECYLYKNARNKNKNYNKEYNTKKNYQSVKKVLNNSDVEDDISHNDENDGSHFCFKLTKSSKYEWYIDSAATCHMSCYEDFFTELNYNINEEIYLADGSMIKAKGKGNGYLYVVDDDGIIQKCHVKNVLFIPEIDGNLLSVRRLTKNGFEIIFENNKCKILYDSKIVTTAYSENNMYKINIKNKLMKTQQKIQFNINKGSMELWHRRLGHRDINALKLLNDKNLIEDIQIIRNKNKNIIKCEVCLRGKMTRKSFPKYSENYSKEILDLIHSDICGPMKTTTPGGNKYILTFIDDFSRYTTIYLLKNKSEVFCKYQQFAENMKTRFNKNIKCLRSDNGGEYISGILDEYLKKNGTKHEFTAPYTPEQNGIAERKNRSLTEMANCMLIEADMDKKFWGEAVNTANYLQNRLPTRAHNKTPFEIWNKKKPRLNHVKIFGCNAYVHIPQEQRKKFDEKAIKLKFVGYSEESKAYRLLNTKTGQITISRNVTFIEENNTRNYEQNDENTNEQIVTEDDIDEDIEITLFNNKTEEMKNCIDVVKNLTNPEVSDPKMFKDAMSSADKENWMKAMKEEIDSLNKNHTWELVKPPINRQIISCKWVYKVKNDPVNNTNRYKARLVARGFSQKYGEDYDEIFAPVVKHSTIRILLTLCGIRKMNAKHFDVKTAFLNGNLQETIFMQQPEGFVDTVKPNYVCKLNKSLYGLKQAAKAWNDRINEVLQTIGFRRGEADNCLYSKKIKNEWIYILIYVDDIIMASKSNENIESTGKILNKYFEVKLMGDLKYYLGIEIEKDDDGIFLIHQRNYINKLLKRFQLEDAKDSKIPLDTGYYKNIESGSKLMADVEEYKKAIGSLLYLSVNTRPDIAVSVSILCRKTSNPTEKDWTEIKRIFKYLKATCNNKLKLGEKTKVNTLIGYADADWAGDSTDRKSTSGFVVMLHGSTISWSSRKQTNVALSTTEAEYVSLTELCQEIIWIKKLLVDLNENIENIKVFEDNQSTLKILDHDIGMKTRSKHIGVKYHFVKNLKQSGEILFEYCPTNEMVADMFTKPLNSNKLNYYKNCLGIINSEN